MPISFAYTVSTTTTYKGSPGTEQGELYHYYVSGILHVLRDQLSMISMIWLGNLSIFYIYNYIYIELGVEMCALFQRSN